MIEPAQTQTCSTLKAFIAYMLSFLLLFLDHFSDFKRGIYVIAASEEEFMWVSKLLQLSKISASYLQSSYLATAELPLGLKDGFPPRSVPLQPQQVPQLSLLQDLQATAEHILLFFQILQMLHLQKKHLRVRLGNQKKTQTYKNKQTKKNPDGFGACGQP